jgi:hypothetical protein
MAFRLIRVVFLVCVIGAPAAAQGIFLRFAPRYDFLLERYDSPWKEYFSYAGRTAYGVEGDVGYIIQPRRMAINVRISAGLKYDYVKLKAEIADPGALNEGFIVNNGFEETYELLSIPVTVELLYSSKTSRLAPGIYLSLYNSFVKKSGGVTRLVDGSSETYDIPVPSYVPSISGGAFVDFALSRTVSLELTGGYTHMMNNILKDTKADLRFHAVSVKAGVLVRIR